MTEIFFFCQELYCSYLRRLWKKWSSSSESSTVKHLTNDLNSCCPEGHLFFITNALSDHSEGMIQQCIPRICIWFNISMVQTRPWICVNNKIDPSYSFIPSYILVLHLILILYLYLDLQKCSKRFLFVQIGTISIVR